MIVNEAIKYQEFGLECKITNNRFAYMGSISEATVKRVIKKLLNDNIISRKKKRLNDGSYVRIITVNNISEWKRKPKNKAEWFIESNNKQKDMNDNI